MEAVARAHLLEFLARGGWFVKIMEPEAFSSSVLLKDDNEGRIHAISTMIQSFVLFVEKPRSKSINVYS